MRARRCLLWPVALSIATLACADTTAGGEPECLLASRVCDGQDVLVCAPASGRLELEQTCPPWTRCFVGECRADLDATGDADRRDAGDGSSPGDLASAPDEDAGAGADPSHVDPGGGTDGVEPSDPGPLADGDGDAETGTETSSGEDTDGRGEGTGDAGVSEASDTAPADTSGTDGATDDAGAGADGDGLDDADSASDVADGTAGSDPGADPGPTDDPFAPGPLLYERVANLALKDDLRRVRWHPSGDFAVILGTSGRVARYRTDGSPLELVTTLGSQVADLDVDANGAFFVIVGEDHDGSGVVWRIDVGAGAALTPTEVAQPAGRPVAIAREPAGSRWVIGATISNGVNMLHLWADGVGVTGSRAYSGAGIRDLMWGDPSLYFGEVNVITSDGVNGAGSQTWLVDLDDVLPNGWKASMGNPGGAGWRPGGGYGILTGWTSNKVYVFDGAWTTRELPGIPTGGSPNAIAWRDGRRALVVGGAVGSPRRGIVVDHRPGDAAGYDGAAWQDVSIPGFGDAPWFATLHSHLLDADWRPGVACDEGLIVAADPEPGHSPGLGLVIRFYDASDPACSAASGP